MATKEILYNANGVAHEKDCTNMTVGKAIREGNLPAIPVIGGNGEYTGYVIKKADMKKWKPRPVGRPSGK